MLSWINHRIATMSMKYRRRDVMTILPGKPDVGSDREKRQPLHSDGQCNNNKIEKEEHMKEKSSECTKCLFERETGLHLSVTDIYVDGDGHESEMRWIPRFTACFALTSVAAVATPSGRAGNWFHPKKIQSAWKSGVDYVTALMGGWWCDNYLASAFDATRKSQGTVCSGSAAYVSQRGVAPMVNQNLAHFRKHLASRFEKGGFAGSGGCVDWSGKGGLITNQHWEELRIWASINGWELHGNTHGYHAPGNIPSWHKDPNEIGILDESWPASWGLSITGGGPRSWDVPVGDFCGNRWEFADGLRLHDGVIYSAGKTINPWTDPQDGYKHKAFVNTALSLTGVESGQSIASYREEESIRLQGIPASSIAPEKAGIEGGGIWYYSHGETSALRGGSALIGPRCPGALDLSSDPWIYGSVVAARAVLVP